MEFKRRKERDRETETLMKEETKQKHGMGIRIQKEIVVQNTQTDGGPGPLGTTFHVR